MAITAKPWRDRALGGLKVFTTARMVDAKHMARALKASRIGVVSGRQTGEHEQQDHPHGDADEQHIADMFARALGKPATDLLVLPAPFLLAPRHSATAPTG